MFLIVPVCSRVVVLIHSPGRNYLFGRGGTLLSRSVLVAISPIRGFASHKKLNTWAKRSISLGSGFPTLKASLTQGQAGEWFLLFDPSLIQWCIRLHSRLIATFCFPAINPLQQLSLVPAFSLNPFIPPDLELTPLCVMYDFHLTFTDANGQLSSREKRAENGKAFTYSYNWHEKFVSTVFSYLNSEDDDLCVLLSLECYHTL